jgi:hypothetical protein
MNVLNIFVEICFLMRGPQDTPSDAGFFKYVLGLYFAVNTLLTSLTTNLFFALIQAFAELAMLLGFIWAVLWFSHKTARFGQTATAMLACGALFTIASLPFFYWIETHIGASRILSYTVMLLLVWNLIVSGHILRHALSMPLSFGIGLSFLYVFFSYQILSFLFTATGISS